MQLLWCRCWSRALNPLCPARVSLLLAVVCSPLISQRSPAILISLQASTPATSPHRHPTVPTSLTSSLGASGVICRFLFSNSAFVETVCNHNIEHVVSQIRGRSPILAEMETKGEIMIVGAYYDLDNGVLSLLR